MSSMHLLQLEDFVMRMDDRLLKLERIVERLERFNRELLVETQKKKGVNSEN